MTHGWGIYLDNDGQIDVGRAMEIAGEGCYTVLLHQSSVVRQIRRAQPGCFIMVRAHTLGDWTALDPVAWADSSWQALTDGDDPLINYVDGFTWANEQNLRAESGGKIGADPGHVATWEDYGTIAVWNLAVVRRLRELRAAWIAQPAVKPLLLHHPALAMGHGEDWAYDDQRRPLQGWPTGADGEPMPVFQAHGVYREAVLLCDVLNAHPYRLPGYDVLDEWRGVKRIEKTHVFFPELPLFVDETGQFEIWSEQAPAQLVAIGYYLQGLDYVVGWTPFIMRSPDVAHRMNDWSQNPRVADAYIPTTRLERARPTMREVTVPDPTPQPQPTPTPDPAPDPAPTPPAVTGFPAGRGWWVWYVSQDDVDRHSVGGGGAHCGGFVGIRDTAKASGASHVFIKAGDGGIAWPQLNPTLVRNLQRSGLKVYAWTYLYGGDVDAEIAVALNALEQGVDGLVVDVEAEYRDQSEPWKRAERFCAAVREAAGDRFFGYSPVPVIDYHQALPFVQFNAVCDAVLPQFYSVALGGDPPWTLDRLREQWDRWGRSWLDSGFKSPPLLPVGEAFGDASGEDVLTFERYARSTPAWSYWEMAQARPEHLAAMRAADAEQPQPGPAPDTGAFDEKAALDRHWAYAEAMEADAAAWRAVGDRTATWHADGIEGHAKAIKALSDHLKEIRGY